MIPLASLAGASTAHLMATESRSLCGLHRPADDWEQANTDGRTCRSCVRLVLGAIPSTLPSGLVTAGLHLHAPNSQRRPRCGKYVEGNQPPGPFTLCPRCWPGPGHHEPPASQRPATRRKS